MLRFLDRTPLGEARRAGAPLALAWTLAAGAPTPLTGPHAVPGTASPIVALPAPGTIAELRMPAPSLHDPARSVFVYLPPSYGSPPGAPRRFPVVYLLHGQPGSNLDWPTSGHVAAILNRLIAQHRVPETIVVMPDTHGPGRQGRSLYVDSFDGRCRMATFLSRDLPAWVDRTLWSRPLPSARTILGNSDGGGAAVNLAFRHPDVFGACGGLSGEYELRPGRGNERVLGPHPFASPALASNSPIAYAPDLGSRLRALRIYFDCGVFDLALVDNVRLHRELRRLGVPHVFNVYAGSHEWVSWRAAFERALVTLVR